MSGRDLKQLKALYEELVEQEAKTRQESLQQSCPWMAEAATRRKLQQARRQETRKASRYEVWLRLDALLQLYEALQLRDRSLCSVIDGLPSYQWGHYSALPRAEYDRREAEFEAAGGCKEVKRLLTKLELMRWRPDPLIDKLCAALFGGTGKNGQWRAEDLPEGRKSIWQDETAHCNGS